MVETRLNLPFTGTPTFLRCRPEPDLARLDADVAVLGVPSDEGTPWKPGSRFAPRAIREQSVRFAGYGAGIFDVEEERWYLGHELRHDRIVDCGDVDVVYTNRRKTFDNVTESVRRIVERGAIPIVLGGDHGITYPVVRAWRQPLTIVQFDAHLDFKRPTPDVEYSNGTPFFLISELPNVETIAQVGIRSLRTRPEDLEAARRRGNLVQTVGRFREQGIGPVLARLPSDVDVYISIDIDVLDLPLVPGCASAEPDGLSFAELRQALFAVARRARVVGFDLVDINPMLDVASGATSLLGAHLAIELLGRIVEHPAHAARRSVNRN